MSRLPHPSKPPIPALENEPRVHGVPPPAYKSETDSCSEYSSASAMGKRRMSWTNLVESEENLHSHRVNQFPKVQKPPSITSFGSSSQVVQSFVAPFPTPSTRVPSQMTHYASHHFAVPKGTLVDAAPPLSRQPQQTIPSAQRYSNVHHASSVPPSAAPSEIILTGGKKKKNKLEDCRNWCSNPKHAFCSLCFILLLIAGIVAAIVITQAIALPRRLTLSWQAPQHLRSGNNGHSDVTMIVEDEQIKMALKGNIPFKGNFISYYDFKSNKIGIVDETLKQNGKALACFILNIDRHNIPEMKDFQKAASNGRSRQAQSQGWDESWSYRPVPVNVHNQSVYFNPPIPECMGARWIQLEFAANQKAQKCTDCHDFCLPEYGIEKDYVRDETYLNIIKRDCFYLFVPEWRNYAQANTIEQNQRDFEQFYRMRTGGGDGLESKWINIHNTNPIQAVANASQNAFNSATGYVGQTVDNVKSVFGSNYQGVPANSNGFRPQQQNGQFGVNTFTPPNNGINGVVNLPNGNSPNTGYYPNTNGNNNNNPNTVVYGNNGGSGTNMMGYGNGFGSGIHDGKGISGSLGGNRPVPPRNNIGQSVQNGIENGLNSAVNTVQEGVQSVGSAVQSGIQSLGNRIEEGKQSASDLIFNQNGQPQQFRDRSNGVNSPSGYFQQMNPQGGGYAGYDNQYIQRNNMGTSNQQNQQQMNRQPSGWNPNQGY